MLKNFFTSSVKPADLSNKILAFYKHAILGSFTKCSLVVKKGVFYEAVGYLQKVTLGPFNGH